MIPEVRAAREQRSVLLEDHPEPHFLVYLVSAIGAMHRIFAMATDANPFRLASNSLDVCSSFLSLTL